MRSISITSLALAASLSCGATAALAQTQTCAGHDVLADLKAAEPQAYAAVRAAADNTENANALLWKIQRTDDPDKPASYLFGTLHLSDDRVHKLSPVVLKAIDTARRVAVEVEDLTPTRIAEALITLREQATLPEDQSLDKMLTPQELEKVRERLARIELKGEAVLRVRPWVVQMALGVSECERSRRALGRRSLDAEIENRAEVRGVGTVGLETVELQLEALAAVPDEHQLRILKASLAQLDRLDDMQETMVRLYVGRDLGAIWPLQIAVGAKHGASSEAFEAFAQSLVVARNVQMRDRALLHLQTGGIFVAVGALHLPGRNGLVRLLQDEGYTVTAVE